VSIDILLFKINYPDIKNFLLKYTQTDTPDGSAVRKFYDKMCIKIPVLCGNI
jgi:hypothetical protein